MQNKIEKKDLFKFDNEHISRLLELGAEKYFSTEYINLLDIFVSPECAVCMDEGTACKNLENVNKFCIAGSGILFPASSRDERLKKVSELFNKIGITKVTSHDGCGAAGIAYRLEVDSTDATDQKINIYAKDWSKDLVDKMNGVENKVEHIHINLPDIMRPAELHIARTIWFDDVGGMNPDRLEKLPSGFVIESAYLPSEYALVELITAVGIAFGDHGFGELFTVDNPFVIVIFSKNNEKLDILKKEIKKILSDDDRFNAGRIKIDGVIIG